MSRRTSFLNLAPATVIVVAVVALAGVAFAQLPGFTGNVSPYAPPFDMIGFIQKATLNSASNANNAKPSARTRGGYIWVNNHKITVPDNTVLQMPAAAMTWADLFDPAIGPQTANGTQTGMALADNASSKLYGSFEVHVQGNIVNGEYIAGLIFLSQQSLNSGQGFITRIDYLKGDLYVSGAIGGRETRVQINDPIGRFGKSHSPDQRFTIDEDNPTIHAETGYPMCVPRSDPAVQIDNLCPEYNRLRNPAGGYVMNYTMPDPSQGNITPDARIAAPFEVGDYITYAGVLLPTNVGTQPDPDVPNSYYLSAYNIVANVGIYTAPGSDPVYVTIEETLQGTGGVPNPDFPQETTSKAKVIAFATDSSASRFASISARDTDCNGNVVDRDPWVAFLPIDPGPPVGAKRGRIKWQPNGGAFLPPGREVHVVMSAANTSTPTANGLFPGQYYAPQFDFIFPENLGIGNPPVALNFRDFPFLTNGIGPFGDSDTVVGPLIPFPDLNAPAATCSFDPNANTIPTADAGPAITLQAAAGVTSVSGMLQGSGSGPTGVTLSYQWQVVTAPSGAPQMTFSPSAQNAQPIVTLSDVSTITSPITYQLSLTASYSNGTGTKQSTPSLTTVTVLPGAKPPTITTGLSLSPSPSVTAGATVTASAGAVFNPPQGSTASNVLTYVFTPSSGAPVTVQQPSGTTVSVPITAPSTAGTFTVNLTVTDSLGGSTTATPQSVTVVSASAPAPSATSITANPLTVASGGTVTLTANGVTNPSGLPLAFTWTITNAANNTVYKTIQSTTASTTFNAPTLAPTGTAVNLRVSLSLANTGSSTPPFVINNGASVTVQPMPADTITLVSAIYRTSRARFDLNVTTTPISASTVLTATISYFDSATQTLKTASAQMINGGAGAYTVTFTGFPTPSSVTVTSTAGGKLTVAAGQITFRK